MKTLDAKEVWSRACAELQQVLHPDVFSRWIAVIDPVEMAEGTLILRVDNDFYQSWLEDNYLPLIRKAIRAICEEEISISFRVERRSDAAPAPAEPKRQTFVDRLTRRPKVQLNPNFTFAQFIVGSSNSFPHAACRAVAESPARAYNPLFIYGGTGLGKTHLMQAIGHHVYETSRAAVCYVTTEALLNEYIEALRNQDLVQFRRKYRTADLLLIDDIHFLAGKERIQEEFFHTFNALFDAHKQIVMTSDRPAAEITGLEQRLVSRFEWGLVTELESPDLETRLAILREKQAAASIQLPEPILQFIANNIRSNIRRLEGALIRAISFASLTAQPLSVEALKNLLRDTIEQEQASALSFGVIQRAVAEHYDVRLADMTSARRNRSVSVPRQVAMFLCRRMTSSSLPDIAASFDKTHATVLHACKSVESRMDVDDHLRRDVRLISLKLGKSVV